ncbi:tetratricopeptide repeat protein [Ascidiaceihabitans sp.]|uniref:tetratricopeptide repeat protein n=1 Tax=Ascidiaceihabitans sp. TaxID=1872644 RepID=UPI003299111A
MLRFLLSSALVGVLSFSGLDVAQAQSAAGAYLAGREAAVNSDFKQAAAYYSKALARDAQNAEFMDGAVVSLLSLGQLDRALPIAKLMEDAEIRAQAAHMVVIADLVKREDFATLAARDAEILGIGPLVDGLLAAWTKVGLGDMQGALDSFDALMDEPSFGGFARYQKAMALASTGDFAAAEAVYASDDAGALNIMRRGIMARAEILSQLDRNEDALQTLRLAFGAASDPELARLIEGLEAGKTMPFTHVTSARDGHAEVFHTLADVLRGEAGANYTLLYARLAQYIRPDHIDSALLNASLLEELGQFDLAIAAYESVPDGHAATHAAQLGRAAALRRSGKPDAAIEALQQMSRRFPDMAPVFSTLGDVYRQQERYSDAVGAYDRTLELMEPDARGRWFSHYARAIAHERLDDWDLAEADFRQALALNPDQPQVLNYLGYSMVEKQINLDEALGMIEKAVAKEPDSGYIVDSLGWVLYRLGRYGEAVAHMERAVELMPVDPVVNDHLGDVYWAVGRTREAEFQWSRALSFAEYGTASEDVKPDRIRRKLEVGLDVVLEEEGADPLKVADDN